MNINTDTIYLIIAVVSALFGVIMFVRRPQEQGEVTDAVFNERINDLNKVVANLRDNHIHTIEQKLDKHIEDQYISQTAMTKDITRIYTILEERLPKK